MKQSNLRNKIAFTSEVFVKFILAFSLLILSVFAFSAETAPAVDSISSQVDVVNQVLDKEIPIDTQKADMTLNYVIVPIFKTLANFPKVGEYVAKFVAISGTIAGVATILIFVFWLVMQIPIVALKMAGKKELADKIMKFTRMVIYFLKKISIMNAQKDELKKN